MAFFFALAKKLTVKRLVLGTLFGADAALENLQFFIVESQYCS